MDAQKIKNVLEVLTRNVDKLTDNVNPDFITPANEIADCFAIDDYFGQVIKSCSQLIQASVEA
ncbi:unnamed protein product, partial [marine sediment metagenome]